jgi:hypothetical protein
LNVRFCLAEAQTVELSVFDRLGRKEATLVSGAMTAGGHEVALRGGLAPGTHFFRLAARTGAVTGKLIVVNRD